MRADQDRIRFQFGQPLWARLAQLVAPVVFGLVGLWVTVDSSDVEFLAFGTNDGDGSWLVSYIIGPIMVSLGVAWALVIVWKATRPASAEITDTHLRVVCSIFLHNAPIPLADIERFGYAPNSGLGFLLHSADQWIFFLREPQAGWRKSIAARRAVGGYVFVGCGFNGAETNGHSPDEVLTFLRGKGLAVHEGEAELDRLIQKPA